MAALPQPGDLLWLWHGFPIRWLRWDRASVVYDEAQSGKRYWNCKSWSSQSYAVARYLDACLEEATFGSIDFSRTNIR